MIPSTTIAATYPVTFPHFSSLPPELRNQIWNHALPDKDRPALFPYRRGCWCPAYLSESDERYLANHDNIDMEFRGELLEPIPVEVPIYSVNCEARGIALAWAHRQGIRVHFCKETRRHVFTRLFDDEQDTLYVAPNKFDDFVCEPWDRAFEPDLLGRMITSGPSVRRIAVLESLFQTMILGIDEVFHQYGGVQVIFIIVNAHDDMKVQQRWELENTQGKALLCDKKHGRFDWGDGENTCDEAIYRWIEAATKGLGEVLAKNHVGDCLRSFQPVRAVRR